MLKKHARRINNFKKKKMKLLTNEQLGSFEKPKICYICGEEFEDKFAKNTKHCKDRDHCHYACKYSGAAHSICNLDYSIPKEITVIFLTMDLDMIIIL